MAENERGGPDGAGGGGGDGGFAFPDTRYAHEDPDDPLCVAGLERNARDLHVAMLTCPDGLGDVEDHLARIAPRLGITRGAGLDYCDIGIMLERLTDLADLLERRPFLPMSHLRLIARAVIAMDEANLGAFTDRLLRYLAPRRENQTLVGYRALDSQLCRIIGDIEPLARPMGPDDEPGPKPGAGSADFGIDDRCATYTFWHIGMRADLAREALAIIDAIAAAHDCNRNEALLLALRGETTGVRVTFNLYRDVAGGPAWMSGPGWLDEIATAEWVSRVTHLRIASNGDTSGYTPTGAMVAFLEGRDGVCRFPGCDRPAHRTDKDHVRNYDHDDPASGGPTATANLQCLCQHHHNLKTSRHWHAVMDDDGAVLWMDHEGAAKATTVPDGPLAHIGRRTFDQRATRLTGTIRGDNRTRIAADPARARDDEEAAWLKSWGTGEHVPAPDATTATTATQQTAWDEGMWDGVSWPA